MNEVVRKKLTGLTEITFLEAVMWVSGGHHPDDQAYETWQIEISESEERFCDAFRKGQDRLGLASLTCSPLSEGIEQVLSKQELLSEEELDILEKSKSAMEDDLQNTRLFRFAMSELFKHASEGRVIVRAKPDPWSTLPEPLDPAYFRNPVTFNAYEQQFVFDPSVPMDEYAMFRSNEELVQYQPLVDVDSLRSAFPDVSKPNKYGSLRRAARDWVSKQTGKKWIKRALQDHLRDIDPNASDYAILKMANEISKNPKYSKFFSPGRPNKEMK